MAQVAAGIPSLVDTVATNDQSAALVCNVGFGSGFWDMISPGKRPAGLRPFTAIDADGRTAPSTGGDVLVHIISKRQDLNFELATQITNRLGDSVEVMDEVHGFRYLDSRDLTGFIDGTENPEGDEDRARVAMLRRMLGTNGDGQHDHLMDFTQAVSGAHFFAPSLEVLTSL